MIFFCSRDDVATVMGYHTWFVRAKCTALLAGAVSWQLLQAQMHTCTSNVSR